MMSQRDWSTYLLECADGSLYCGVAKEIETRLKKHNQGIASKYTRSRLPVKVAAKREGLTKKEAYQLEYQIKKMPAHKKIAALKGWDFKIESR